MDLTQFIRDIHDFPKPGIQFKDITPLLAEPRAFELSVRQLIEHYQGRRVDAIAAAEARGFLFAAPMALLMQKALVPLRKPGKLPYQTYALEYDLEYGKAELHVHVDGIAKGAEVLLIDDVLATGGTMEAACKLVQKAGGHVVGCAFLIELGFLKGRDRLRPHEIFSLLRY